MKIIVGVALLAGEAALMFIPGLQVAAIWAFANTIGETAFAALTIGIASMAAGLVMGGIADMLSHTPGSAIAARNPIAPWQVQDASQKAYRWSLKQSWSPSQSPPMWTAPDALNPGPAHGDAALRLVRAVAVEPALEPHQSHTLPVDLTRTPGLTGSIRGLPCSLH